MRKLMLKKHRCMCDRMLNIENTREAKLAAFYECVPMFFTRV